MGHMPSSVRHLRMQNEQNVCEHDVIMGVLKKSLQTWQRRPDSTEPMRATGVSSQSIGSATSSELSVDIACPPCCSQQTVDYVG